MSSAVDRPEDAEPDESASAWRSPADTARKILDERARHLATLLSDDEFESDFVEVLTITIGRDRFAIETRFIKEVLRNVEWTSVPGAGMPLGGVINLRGEVLAVMLLDGVLSLTKGIEPEAYGEWIVVLGIDQTSFGISVSQVTEVLAIPVENIVRPATGSSSSQSNLVRGVTRDALTILDGQAVLEDERFVIDDG